MPKVVINYLTSLVLQFFIVFSLFFFIVLDRQHVVPGAAGVTPECLKSVCSWPAGLLCNFETFLVWHIILMVFSSVLTASTEGLKGDSTLLFWVQRGVNQQPFPVFSKSNPSGLEFMVQIEVGKAAHPYRSHNRWCWTCTTSLCW